MQRGHLQESLTKSFLAKICYRLWTVCLSCFIGVKWKLLVINRLTGGHYLVWKYKCPKKHTLSLEHIGCNFLSWKPTRLFVASLACHILKNCLIISFGDTLDVSYCNWNINWIIIKMISIINLHGSNITLITICLLCLIASVDHISIDSTFCGI